jgi:hypothetical protein
MLTAQEILKEYTNCVLDPIYTIETYFKTFDKTNNGFVPFYLFEKQKEIVESYEKYRFNLVAKPRQAGVSTTTAAYLAVKVAFADKDNPEAILIVANKQDMAFEFLAKIKDFLNQIPRWVWGSDYYGTPEKERKTIFISDSKKEIKLPNGCRVKAVATSKDALRGYTPTYLIMDEAAFIEDGKELFGAALTALGTGGHATLISTPNGQDPLYYETYDLAIKKKNNFNIIEMRWYQDNRYNKDLSWYKYKDKEKTEKEQINETEFTFESYERFIKDGYKPTSSWYEEMCRGMNNDARMIAQELDVSFLGSGGNVVSDEYIQHHKTNNVEDPKYVSGEDNELWIWEDPIEGHEYILASDVSRGDGEDSSTVVVIDFTTMTQVVEFQGKVPPDKLADILYEYGMLYNALVVVDITGGMGVATVLKLQEMKYPNLYYDDKGKALKQRKDVGKYDTKKETAGFQVGSDRTRLVAHFEKMVRINRDEGLDHGIKIRSERLISELNTFVYINGRADHAKGKHDDIIMAMAMALFVLEYSFKQLKQLKTKTKSMLASWVVSSGNESYDKQREMMVPSNKPEPKKPNFKPQVAKNMQDPQGQYMWLFSGYR